MIRFGRHIVFLLIFGISVIPETAAAQEEFDSLFSAAALLVFDDPDKAITLSRELIEKNEDNPARKIEAMLIISNAYSSKRDYPKSLEYALRARDLNMKRDDPVSQLKILNKIAAQYHSLGVNDKALEVLDDADAVFRMIPDKDSLWLIMGNNNAIRGFVYREQLSCDVAIDYFNRALENYKNSPSDMRRVANSSVISYNKGNCYITLGKLDSAALNYSRSEKNALEIGANSLQAFSLKGMAEVSTLKGEYNRAISILDRADSLNRSVADQVLNVGIYRGLSNNYLALNDWNRFLEYEEKYRDASHKVRLSSRETIMSLLDDYEEEAAEQERRTRTRYGAGIIFFLLALGGTGFLMLKNEISFKKKLKEIKKRIQF